MTRKQFFVLLGALVVLLVAGLLLMRSEQSAWNSGDIRVGQRLMPGLKLEDVATISIRDAGATLTLVRREGGWRVNERADFPADADRVRELLLRLVELKVVQTEAVAEAQRARLQLLEPAAGHDGGAGTRIELKDGGGAVLARLLLGKKVTAMVAGAALGPEAGVATGRYALTGDGAVVLVSEALAQAEAKPESWLSKELIRVERTRSISATGPDGRQRYAMSRESEASDWKLSGGGNTDPGRIQDAASALASMSLADVVAEPVKTDTGLDRGVVVKAQTFDNLAYTIRIGAKVNEDRYYAAIAASGDPPAARIAGAGETVEEKAKQDKAFEERRTRLADRLAHEKTLERWTYLVPKSSLEPLLRERAQFLREKKAAKKP